MSKEGMLGLVTRALFGVQQHRLGVVRDIPVEFEKNEHGHIIFKIAGRNLTGAEEIKRLKKSKYHIGFNARHTFMSRNNDGYDARHRLVAVTYRIVLFPGTDIANDAHRTVRNCQIEAAMLGYGKPLAGIIPCIREGVSNRQMKEWKFLCIAALHEPIKDANNEPRMLCADLRGKNGEHGWVSGCINHPDSLLPADAAYAFAPPVKLTLVSRAA
jgi:hypothetical protein